MKTYTYSCVIDSGVYTNPRTFAKWVAIYLADPDGWESKGYTFSFVTKNPQILIHLTTTKGLVVVGCDPALNCAVMNGKDIYINFDLWSGKTANKSQLNLMEYRQYILSHEMGHILGYGHVKCPGVGQLAPIMLQQTKGIGACVPSTNV